MRSREGLTVKTVVRAPPPPLIPAYSVFISLAPQERDCRVCVARGRDRRIGPASDDEVSQIMDAYPAVKQMLKVKLEDK